MDTPDGRSFIPLFLSYQSLVGIFGTKIHVGVVCFETAKKLCMSEENVAGIVLGPGVVNQIFNRRYLEDLV